jgi:hypothetical protein
MRKIGLALMALVAVVAVVALAPAWGQRFADSSDLKMVPDDVLWTWPASSEKTALAMIEKYGQPGQVTDDAMVWYNNGPWKRTVVHRQASDGDDGTTAIGVLEQTITFQLPEDRFAVLDSFTRGMVGDMRRNELSSRSSSEKKNFLAINLAKEVISGDKTLEEARVFYYKQMSLMEAGKSSRYTEGFLFTVDNERGRPD